MFLHSEIWDIFDRVEEVLFDTNCGILLHRVKLDWVISEGEKWHSYMLQMIFSYSLVILSPQIAWATTLFLGYLMIYPPDKTIIFQSENSQWIKQYLLRFNVNANFGIKSLPQYKQRQHRSDSIPKRAMQQKEPGSAMPLACRMSQAAGQLLHDYQSRAIWAMQQQLTGSTMWQCSELNEQGPELVRLVVYIAPPIRRVRGRRFSSHLPQLAAGFASFQSDNSQWIKEYIFEVYANFGVKALPLITACCKPAETTGSDYKPPKTHCTTRPKSHLSETKWWNTK